MKVILKFDFNDDDDKRLHDLALKGEAYSKFVWDYWNDIIRPLYKNELPQEYKDGDKLLGYMRTQFLQCLHDNGLRTSD